MYILLLWVFIVLMERQRMLAISCGVAFEV